VKWDIFASRKKERRHHRKDEIDEMIDIIEKFAPRKYRSERDAFYYNYKIMPLYLKPLFSLLQLVLHGYKYESFRCYDPPLPIARYKTKGVL